MRYLAIDLGDKRTGLAVGDDETRIATPLTIIEARGEGQRIDRLASVIEEHAPDVLVVGLPLDMTDTEGPAARKVRAFAGLLTQRFGLPVRFVDERLSSYAADQLMARTGLTHQGKKARRDAVAAAVILQTFLDSLGP